MDKLTPAMTTEEQNPEPILGENQNAHEISLSTQAVERKTASVEPQLVVPSKIIVSQATSPVINSAPTYVDNMLPKGLAGMKEEFERTSQAGTKKTGAWMNGFNFVTTYEN